MDGFSGYNQIKMYPDDKKQEHRWVCFAIRLYLLD